MIMLLLFGKRAHENEKEPKKLIKYLFSLYKEQNSPRTLYFLSTQIYKYLDLLLCAQNAHGSEWVNWIPRSNYHDTQVDKMLVA